MKSRKAMRMPPGVQNRLAELHQRTVEMASESGLFQVDDRFDEIIEPQLRNAAWEFHGAPGVTPEVLERRQADLRQRGDEASRSAAAFFEAIRDASPAHSPARMLGWRGSLLVVVTAALAGLASPEITLRGCAILALSAATGVLALPLAPGAARFAVGAARGITTCARDLAAAAMYYQGCRKLRRHAWAAADYRERVDHWVAAQMRHLVAEYEFHKALAASARLAL